jgi:hypothetical protein
MKWVKKGKIFAPDHDSDWMVSHASVPVADKITDEVLRIYFGTRDGEGRSHTSYLEVEADNPQKILYMHDKPVLSLGELGTFDDRGIMPSWLVSHDGNKYLYYIGWNPQVTVPYRLSIGLAISKDGGNSFHKVSNGPICGRAVDEPYFNTAPCVLVDGESWKMWYISCTGWQIIHGHPEPSYLVKYAESADGIHWHKTGRICIDSNDSTEAIGRPCVFVEGATYKMFYSYRSTINYRTDSRQSYRLGYAESADGLSWNRKDDEVGIDKSGSGWDSQMMEYCYVYDHRAKKYLFYNGNGFGATGFGYAVLDEERTAGDKPG